MDVSVSGTIDQKTYLKPPPWISLWFFTIQNFWATLRLPWKTVAQKYFTVLNIVFTFRSFEELVLALKNSVPWIHCIEYTFLLFRNFEQLALDLKNRVALKIFTALNILFTFRMFEQELPGIFHLIEIFLSFKNFKQLALALKTEFTLKFLNLWGWVARPPASNTCAAVDCGPLQIYETCSMATSVR